MLKDRKDGSKRPYAIPEDVVSSTECTGMTQFVPENADQNENFKDIYDIPMGKKKGTKR